VAYYGSKDVALYVGAYNVTPDLESVNFKASAILDERIFLGNAWPTAIDTGQRRGELSCSGIYNSISGATPILANLTGTDAVVSYTHEGGTGGSRCWNFRSAKVSEVEASFDTEKMDSLATSFAITGAVNQGYVVAPLAARTTDGSTDADDVVCGTLSTGARLFMHITAISGGGTVTVQPRSSSDGVTYGNCSAAFTAASTVTSESIAVTGTVNQYMSIAWTWAGGAGNSFTALVAVARD
jgi:hypothetical protein